MKALLRKLFAPKTVLHFDETNHRELLKIDISSKNPTDIEKQVRSDVLNLCVNRWHEVEHYYTCCLIMSNLEDGILLKKGLARFVKQGWSCGAVVVNDIIINKEEK